MNKQTKKILMQIHTSLMCFLLEYKYSEFSIKNEKIKKDILFLIILRKYLGINKEDETYKQMFYLIQDNIEII